MAVDAAPAFAPTPRTRRRKVVNRAMEALATVAALAAVAVLGVVIVSVVRRGASALDWGFLTKTPAPFGLPGGGIANAIVGSAVLVGLAAAMALPVGVLVAVYVAEFAPRRVAAVVRLALDVLNGVPSIVIGIFVFTLFVVGRGQSAFAGAFALAIIMLPLISRATQEVLRLVPSTLREGALALGASRWRTVVGIVLPSSLGGITTGTTLAIARATGETAPLLFTCSLFGNAVSGNPHNPLASLTVMIFTLSESSLPADQTRAWAAAVVLMAFVLVLSVVARAFLARSRRNLRR